MAKPDIRVAPFAGPGAKPQIGTVRWPKIPRKAALIKTGACGVCGTDRHILKGHWPEPLPWPFTLGLEIGAEKGEDFTEDFMGKPLDLGSKVMIPPLMFCGHCRYCVHFPETANKCLTPVCYRRYLGFGKGPHLRGGWAECVYVGLDMLPGTNVYKLHDDMSLRLGALSEPMTYCIRAFNRATRRLLQMGRQRRHPGLRADRHTRRRRGAGNGGGPRRLRHRRRPRDGLLGPSERGAGRHGIPARRRHLRRDGPIHRRRKDRDFVAPHLHEGYRRPRLPGSSPATACRSASARSIARAANTRFSTCRGSIPSPRTGFRAPSPTRWR